MRICQILQGVNNMSAGTTYSVGLLSEKLSKSGHSVKVSSFSCKPKKWPFEVTLDNTYKFLEKCKLLSLQSIVQFRKVSLNFDIMHCHGVWRMANLFSLFLPKKYKAKIIWSPRGMFSDWSWNYHYIIKKPFWILFQKPAIEKASCFHATALSEYKDIRKRGLMQPVAIIPNGVVMPSLDECKKEKSIVFLSRIHKKKGLELLLDAWEKIEQNHPEWGVKIAGPLDSTYASEIKKHVLNRGLSRVELLGEVTGKKKKQLLSSAGVFILPSYSENFGIAIAEALAHGTAVITTTETPWSGVKEKKCGWYVKPELEFIQSAMESALSTPMKELIDMGKRGEVWMKEDYSWEVISNQMELVYGWLIGNINKPDFVIVD